MSSQTLDELMRRARGIKHEQTRRESEDYLEMVMFRDSWNDVQNLFDGYFGAPIKGAGNDADDNAERVSETYGGITREQVLYHLQRAGSDHVAMIWPWSDGKRMTVKIAQECR